MTCADASLRRRSRAWAGAVLCWMAVGLSCPPAHAAVQVEVEVSGLEGEEEDNAMALLGIARERENPNLTPRRLRRLHQLAPDQIREALEPFGYYEADVEGTLREPREKGGVWRARYRVHRGDPVRIGEVSFQVSGPGANDPGLPLRFGLEVGAVLRHADYEAALRRLKDQVSALGYLDYKLTRHRVEVYPKEHRARVSVYLGTGPRYYLGAVRFRQDLLDDRLLQRYVQFRPGEVYDRRKPLKLQANLLGSEYFDQVEIMPLRDAAVDHRIPIEVVASPNKPNKFRIGPGYSTDMGPRITLDWTRRWVNRHGHKTKLLLNASQTLSRLRGEYRIPGKDPTRDYFALRPEVVFYDTANRQGTLYKLKLLHSRLGEGGWRRTLSLDYRYEDYDVAETDARSNELVPGIDWSKTVSDNPVYTRRGHQIRFSLRGALEDLVSETSYLGSELRLKWIRRFAKQYRVIARGTLGAVLAHSVQDLPASRRFFAGGDNSIRGYDLDSLGPEDPDTGEIVGGRFLATGSLELERRIVDDWSAALFYDAGNAYDPDLENRIAQGVGLGLRWLSPVGQVRVDFAVGLNGDHKPYRLHIVVGPDF
jgi:translocation and assembly module TamA